MITRTKFTIGSESLHSWENRHPDTRWIVLSGNISYEIFAHFCLEFDYTKYNRISFEDITIGDKIFENGYQVTVSEYCHIMVYDYDAKLPVLDKMLLGKDNVLLFQMETFIR